MAFSLTCAIIKIIIICVNIIINITGNIVGTSVEYHTIRFDCSWNKLTAFLFCRERKCMDPQPGARPVL